MKLLFLPLDVTITDITLKLNDAKLNEFNTLWTTTQMFDLEPIKQIVDQLPFTKITVANHKIQQRSIGQHVDVHDKIVFEPGEKENITENEPCGYRLLIVGQQDSLEVFDGVTWHTAKIPHVPCCYLLDSGNSIHRVKSDDNRELIYFRGYIDSVRHQQLIEKSLQKYSDCAIYSATNT